MGRRPCAVASGANAKRATMIELDDTGDLVGAGVGWHRADLDDFFARERRRLLEEVLEALDRSNRQARRRARRERLTQALNVIRAAQRAGLPVKAATVEGVALTFGDPEAAGKAATLTPLEAWKAKHARQA